MNPEIIRILISLTVFAVVFLVSTQLIGGMSRRQAQKSAINKRMEMIGRGIDRDEVLGELIKRRPKTFDYLPEMARKWAVSFQRMTFMSGIQMSFGRIVTLLAIAAIGLFVGTLVILLLIGTTLTFGTIQIALIFAVALGLFVPILIIQKMAQNRRKLMENQFPVALDIFVRALRTGHPVASAIDLLTTEMEDPIGSEFGLVSDEVAYGTELVDALSSMADRWDLDDMRMFVVSLSLQSQTGGNLAEILENISKVIRDRAQMFMKVRALSSEGRMTGWMLTVLPVFAFVTTFLGSPSFYLNVADDPIFIYGAIGLLILYVIGVLTIRRMVDLKV